VHNQVICVQSDSAGASAFLMMPDGPMDRDGAGEHVVWLPGGLVLVRDDFRARGFSLSAGSRLPAGKPGLGHRMLD